MSEDGATRSRLLSAEELAGIVDRLAEAISRDHPSGFVLVGLLKGSVCLVADLARRVAVPCAVDFLSLSSYGPGGQRVRLSKDLDVDVTGKAVVLAVDVVDRGLTVTYVHRLLTERGARSVDVCALLDRRSKRLLPVELRYVGEIVGDEYVVGYGLDLDERYRNLSEVVRIDPKAVRAAEPAGVDTLFER